MQGNMLSCLPAIAKLTLVSWLCTGVLFPSNASASNFYVNDGATTNDIWTTGPGSNANPGSAALPYAGLKFAIDNNVLGIGDTVFVDAGTYNDEAILIGTADAGVVVMGAGRDLTIFDQLLKTSHWMVVEGDHVHLHSMKVTRYGFSTGLFGQALTFQDCIGGIANDIDFDDMGTSGGEAAVYITMNSTITTEVMVSNCLLRNTLGNFGGGIDVCSNTISSTPTLSVTISGCLIENNGKNNFNGGGLLVYNGLTAGSNTNPPTVTVNSSVIGSSGAGNVAMRGGGIYIDDGAVVNLNSVCVSNNIAQAVSGRDGGGGIYVLDGTVNFTDGMVVDNGANLGTPKYGGGIFINKLFSGTSILNATRVVISGNTGLDGAGLYMDRSAVSLRNCLFYDNVANDEGGAILISDLSATLEMYNCTVTENVTLGNGSDHGGLENKNSGSCVVKNCIFWNNTNRDITDDGGGSVDVSFSIIDPSPAPTFNDQGNNLSVDPLFLNASIDDFRLLNATSPAFDAGTTDGGLAPINDLVQSIRPTIPDMGAYEFGAASTLPNDCPTLRQEILPVLLSSFGEICHVGGNRIYWQSEKEAGLVAYHLESETETWTILANGFAGSYNYDLPEMKRGTIVSLYSEDIEQNFQLLERISLQDCYEDKVDVKSYPTYIKSELNMEIRGEPGTAVEVYIIDLLGKLHKRVQFAQTQSLEELTIPSDELPEGSFYVKVRAGNFSYSAFHMALR